MIRVDDTRRHHILWGAIWEKQLEKQFVVSHMRAYYEIFSKINRRLHSIAKKWEKGYVINSYIKGEYDEYILLAHTFTYKGKNYVLPILYGKLYDSRDVPCKDDCDESISFYIVDIDYEIMEYIDSVVFTDVLSDVKDWDSIYTEWLYSRRNDRVNIFEIEGEDIYFSNGKWYKYNKNGIIIEDVTDIIKLLENSIKAYKASKREENNLINSEYLENLNNMDMNKVNDIENTLL